MFTAQNGLCAICQQPETKQRNGKKFELAVDHDHETGAVRALLCSHCNYALGYFKDSPDLLLAAIAYLQKYKCRKY